MSRRAPGGRVAREAARSMLVGSGEAGGLDTDMSGEACEGSSSQVQEEARDTETTVASDGSAPPSGRSGNAEKVIGRDPCTVW